MRKFLILIWLMLPVVAGAWHYGPGQEQLLLDDVAKTLREAECHVAAKEWQAADSAYERALDMLPSDRTAESRRVRLERAKAQMFNKRLPTAHQELKTLVDELSQDESADPELVEETQAALANSRYYMTWLMRLEGQPKATWEPEIESARQAYRMLAERAESSGESSKASERREDLESTIRLARMDLSDLQGLPLPSQ